MESTGEFWKPVYTLLEDSLTVLVVNAQHIKHVPGRKTDVKDAEWLAELLAHGLLRASFIPPAPQRALRDLTRQRSHLVRERATVVNRMQKVLEWANLKLAAVVTDVTGVSARQMSRRSSRAKPMSASWPIWPRDACARSGPRWSRPGAAIWPPSRLHARPAPGPPGLFGRADRGVRWAD